MSLKHARHNKEVCEFLFNQKDKDFGDWVITTAYYSALHYFHSVLFPDKYESPYSGKIQQFNSFESFYNQTNKSKSKHSLLLQLVEEHVDDEDVIDAFTELKDLCWTARYKDYSSDKQIVNNCFNNIQLISTYCEPLDL